MLEMMNFYKYLLSKLKNLAFNMRDNSNSGSGLGLGSNQNQGIAAGYKRMRHYIKEIEDISNLVSSMLADLYDASKKSDYLKSNNITNTIGTTNNGVAGEIELELTAALRDMNLKLDNLLVNSDKRVGYHLNSLNTKLDSLIASDKKKNKGKEQNKKRLVSKQEEN